MYAELRRDELNEHIVKYVEIINIKLPLGVAAVCEEGIRNLLLESIENILGFPL